MCDNCSYSEHDFLQPPFSKQYKGYTITYSNRFFYVNAIDNPQQRIWEDFTPNNCRRFIDNLLTELEGNYVN